MNLNERLSTDTARYAAPGCGRMTLHVHHAALSRLFDAVPTMVPTGSWVVRALSTYGARVLYVCDVTLTIYTDKVSWRSEDANCDHHHGSCDLRTPINPMPPGWPLPLRTGVVAWVVGGAGGAVGARAETRRQMETETRETQPCGPGCCTIDAVADISQQSTCTVHSDNARQNK
jgi:hypothetical protein